MAGFDCVEPGNDPSVFPSAKPGEMTSDLTDRQGGVTQWPNQPMSGSEHANRCKMDGLRPIWHPALSFLDAPRVRACVRDELDVMADGLEGQKQGPAVNDRSMTRTNAHNAQNTELLMALRGTTATASSWGIIGPVRSASGYLPSAPPLHRRKQRG